MKTRKSMIKFLLLLLAGLSAPLFLNACVKADPNRPSDMPWSRQESWEGTARYGNFPQSR